MSPNPSSATPSPISVTVEVEYLTAQSDPSSNNYAFAYRITVTNHGSDTLQLLSRHWLITDGDQRQREVTGLGVVGEQPYIGPGQSYQYTSGVVLDTAIGTMQGSYQLVGSDNRSIEAPIAPFLLAAPNQVN